MATVLFFNLPAHGHFNPSRPLVTELARRGERVIYFNAAAFGPAVVDAGAEFRAYAAAYTMTPDQGLASPLRTMARLLEASETLLPDLLAQAAAARPDYVIYDSMAPWGKQVAEKLGVPAVCSCSIMYLGPENLGALPGRLLPAWDLACAAPAALAAVARYTAQAARLRRRFGVQSPSVARFFGNPAGLTLVYTSREFQAGGERLDGRFRFVGPLIAPRPGPADFPWDWLAGQPVIYISLGTLFNARREFFRACLAAARTMPYRFVLSIGDRLTPADLGPLPANCLVRAHVPQLDLLPRAAAFLTHGGMNSASESLWFGVPMVVTPQGGDQLVIARRVAEVGAGRVLAAGDATAERIRVELERVLTEPAFRQASARVGAGFRAAGGVVAAADAIWAYTGRTNA